MIWIATLCLLFIAVWLIVNGLNERRWVETHSHDETVASDEGLFPGFTARTRSMAQGGTGAPGAAGGSAAAGDAMGQIKEKLGAATDQMKDAAGKLNENLKTQVADESSFLGRASSRVTAAGGALSSKVRGSAAGGTAQPGKPVPMATNAPKPATPKPAAPKSAAATPDAGGSTAANPGSATDASRVSAKVGESIDKTKGKS